MGRSYSISGLGLIRFLFRAVNKQKEKKLRRAPSNFISSIWYDFVMYILFTFTTLLFRLNWGRLNVSRLNACSVDVNKNIENLLFGALTNLIAVFSDFRPAKLLEVETDEICQKIFSLNYYLTQFDCKWWVIFPTFFHLVEIYHIKVF